MFIWKKSYIFAPSNNIKIKVMKRKDCWALYLVALNEIEKATGERLYFRKNGCGGDIVNKMMEMAKKLNL